MAEKKNAPPRGPVGKASQQFLQSLREKNASTNTITAYRKDLAKFSSYAEGLDWKEIDHVFIRGFLSKLYEDGLGKTSVARALAALRSLYRWLARD